MEYRKQVACHEASHVILAHRLGAGVLDGGIDLDAATGMAGAFGNAAVNIFKPDPAADRSTQLKDLVDSLKIICAGAVSDAKILSKGLRDALRDQPGDEKQALDLLESSSIPKDSAEREEILLVALKLTADDLAKPEVCKMVEAIADATISAGGKLPKSEIEKILNQT